MIRDEDAVIFFNFRADRARQTTKALVEPNFAGFTDAKRPKNLFYVAMTQYEKTWPWLQFVFGPEKVDNILANCFADMQIKNLLIAETEKYAHVTFFFSGGREDVFPGEERILIPSPKEVSTYDKKPEMSAYLVTDAVIEQIRAKRFDLIVLDFANADMVGHTGDFKATVKAIGRASDHRRFRRGLQRTQLPAPPAHPRSQAEPVVRAGRARSQVGRGGLPGRHRHRAQPRAVPGR